ncbi:MAG: Holliday junction resolvase RuvX [Ignavibacteriae bacterium]|nr:MAG: Holliday junction resolvase RuvX [Ignavibacteriota bacterium]
MNYIKDESERILGIDYGKKRIGIAISDPLKMFAIPKVTIKNDLNFENNLRKIFEEFNIVKIIIGYPLKENGEKYPLTEEVEKFAERIKKIFKTEIELVDERYSSAIAWEQIIKGVPSKKKRQDKSLIDMNAAAVILDDYLKINDKNF